MAGEGVDIVDVVVVDYHNRGGGLDVVDVVVMDYHGRGGSRCRCC